MSKFYFFFKIIQFLDKIFIYPLDLYEIFVRGYCVTERSNDSFAEN